MDNNRPDQQSTNVALQRRPRTDVNGAILLRYIIRRLILLVRTAFLGRSSRSAPRTEAYRQTTADVARDVLERIDRPNREFKNTVPDAEAVPKSATASIAVADPSAPQRDTPKAYSAYNESLDKTAEEFLRQMREQTERRDSQLEQDVASLRMEETVEFRFMVGLAFITVAFIVACAVLILSGRITGAVASGVVSLFTGAGTKIISDLTQKTSRRREAAANLREDNIRTLQAIQGALIVRDPSERDRELARLAAWLRQRAEALKIG